MGFRIDRDGSIIPTTLADDLAALAAAGYLPSGYVELRGDLTAVHVREPATVADDGDLDIIGWEHWQDVGGEAGCGS